MCGEKGKNENSFVERETQNTKQVAMSHDTAIDLIHLRFLLFSDIIRQMYGGV